MLFSLMNVVDVYLLQSMLVISQYWYCLKSSANSRIVWFTQSIRVLSRIVSQYQYWLNIRHHFYQHWPKLVLSQCSGIQSKIIIQPNWTFVLTHVFVNRQYNWLRIHIIILAVIITINVIQIVTLYYDTIVINCYQHWLKCFQGRFMHRIDRSFGLSNTLTLFNSGEQ